MLRCGKSTRGGVGCVRKCVRVWGKLWENMLGEVWESLFGCVEVCWGVGVVKKDVGEAWETPTPLTKFFHSLHTSPNTSTQPLHLPNTS